MATSISCWYLNINTRSQIQNLKRNKLRERERKSHGSEKKEEKKDTNTKRAGHGSGKNEEKEVNKQNAQTKIQRERKENQWSEKKEEKERYYKHTRTKRD